MNRSGGRGGGPDNGIERISDRLQSQLMDKQRATLGDCSCADTGRSKPTSFDSCGVLGKQVQKIGESSHRVRGAGGKKDPVPAESLCANPRVLCGLGCGDRANLQDIYSLNGIDRTIGNGW